MELQQSERRRHERIPYDLSTALRVTAARDFPVIDISPGGVYFQSDQVHQMGAVLSIGNTVVSFEARVMSVDLVESNPTMLEYHYLVRCRFEPEIDSLHFDLLLALTKAP